MNKLKVLLLALAFTVLAGGLAFAADATWSTKRLGKSIIHTANLTSSATRTEVLNLLPEADKSYSINIGSGETISMSVSLDHHDDITVGAMLDVSSSMTADHTDTFVGPVTGVAFGNSVTNTTVIKVIQSKK
jgi:hypothetical protein